MEKRIQLNATSDCLKKSAVGKIYVIKTVLTLQKIVYMFYLNI